MPTAPRPCPGGLTSKSSPGVCCCCCCSLIRGRGKQQTLKLCWLTRIPSPGTVPRAGPAAGLGAAGQCFPLQNSHGNQPEENVIAFLNWFAAFHVPQAPSAVPLSAATIFPSFLLCGRSYFGFVQLYLNHLWPEETKQTPKYSYQASHSLQCVLRTPPAHSGRGSALWDCQGAKCHLRHQSCRIIPKQIPLYLPYSDKRAECFRYQTTIRIKESAESENHRITEVGKDLQDHRVQTSSQPHHPVQH